MTPSLMWRDILAYSLQIGLVACIGAAVPVALRLRIPRARLLYWQFLLAACFTLPWLRGWVVAGPTQVGGVFTAIGAVTPAAVHHAIPLAAIALWLLAAGIVVRLTRLGIGLARLAAYRRHGRPLQSPNRTAGVTMLLSDDVAGPVTFGWPYPVILLPADFPGLSAEMREAILCHELLHVARHDWLFTIAEELARALLWFHPAIWWIIGEIQLAREQTVDRAVIEATGAHEPYVDALLRMAGAVFSGAPAPMFLRRRHLKKRLKELVKEFNMATISKTRMTCMAGAAVAFVAAACWLATTAFPLSAAPQGNDAAGVSVNLNGSQIVSRSGVSYPPHALATGVEGTVVVRMKLDSSSAVSDAAVLSGPDELRRAVLQSVLNWRFDKSLALTTQTVNIDFTRPDVTAPPAPDDIYSVGNGVMPPMVISKIAPQYSVEARAAKLSGAVNLSVVVGTDGKAQDIRVTKGLGMGLNEDAVAAVAQWLFRPGTKDGVPVNVRAVIEINFRLR